MQSVSVFSLGGVRCDVGWLLALTYSSHFLQQKSPEEQKRASSFEEKKTERKCQGRNKSWGATFAKIWKLCIKALHLKILNSWLKGNHFVHFLKKIPSASLDSHPMKLPAGSWQELLGVHSRWLRVCDAGSGVLHGYHGWHGQALWAVIGEYFLKCAVIQVVSGFHWCFIARLLRREFL